MSVSVVLCTFNRAESLRETLVSLGQQRTGTLSWQIVVVDNNSSDQTRSVCDQFRDKLPLHYVFEPRQGKSFALNRGVQAATEALVAFTDDDVTLDPDWISMLWDAARRNSQCTIFGGRIFPHWLTPPPAWLVKHANTLLRGPAVCFDLGNTEQPYTGTFWGANLAIRRVVFGTYTFREDLGPNPVQGVRGEETDLQKRLLADGHKALYVPTAIAHHRNPSERMTERYVRHWFTGHGIGKVRLGQAPPGMRVFGAPLLAWIKLGWYGTVYCLTRWTLPSRVWLRAAIRLATCRGIIQESRRRDIV